MGWQTPGPVYPLSFRKRTLLGAAVLACTLAGCQGSGELLSEAQIVDSAGVRVVSFGKLEEVHAPLLTAKLIFRTDPDETLLFRIGAGAFLADGSLLLASEGDSELVLLDSKGAEIRRIGRPGEGPGEYLDPNWLQADGDGGSMTVPSGASRGSDPSFNSRPRGHSIIEMCTLPCSP